MRVLACFAVTAFVGLTLVFSELRWFRRLGMVDRLADYAPGTPRRDRAGLLSVASFRDVAGPLVEAVGTRVAALFGVDEDLGIRLRRVHSPLTVSAFRTRQAGWAGGAFVAGALTSVALGLPAGIAILTVFGSPLLAFLLLERKVAAESETWQRTLFVELPIVAEQLGMLLSAGWSLGAALNRVAERGSGSCSADLGRVMQRMQQGLSESAALREWADLAGVEAVDRLVSVLSLDREAGDIGHLISEEARAIRRDTQRQLIETIERRSQQVWIPVTVAALLPGVLLMGVPFLDALRIFSTQ